MSYTKKNEETDKANDKKTRQCGSKSTKSIIFGSKSPQSTTIRGPLQMDECQSTSRGYTNDSHNNKNDNDNGFLSPREGPVYFIHLNQVTNIKLTKIVSATEFYFQSDKEIHLSYLKKLEDKMEEWYRKNQHRISHELYTDFRPNNFFAWLSKSGHCKRVKIMNDAEPGALAVRVLEIDHGICKTVATDELYPLREKYVKFLPSLSMLAKIHKAPPLHTEERSQLERELSSRLIFAPRATAEAISYFQRTLINQNNPDFLTKEIGVSLIF